MQCIIPIEVKCLNEEKTPLKWFARHVNAEAKKDAMTFSERIGNVASIVCIIIVTSYLVAHQMDSTGFFTSEFTISAMFLLYIPLAYGLFENSVRFFTTSKNTGRIFNVIGAGIFIIVFALLLLIFPFDFTYFADILPSPLRFLLQWISNDIAVIIMVLGLIVAPIMAIYQLLLYNFVKRELKGY